MPEALNFPIIEGEQEAFAEATLRIPACQKLILNWKVPQTGNPKLVVIQDMSSEFVERIASDQSTLVVGRDNSDIPDTRYFKVIFAEDYSVTEFTTSSRSSEISTPRLFLDVLIDTDTK